MGGPMARRLLAAGVDLTVQTRTASHAQGLIAAGARVVESPAELAAGVDVLLACLLDDEVIEAVWLGQAGILEGARPGQVLVEHGTFDPALAQRISRGASEIGASFLDVPVTGGPEGAEKGELVLMAGGGRSWRRIAARWSAPGAAARACS
jgi:3-hydroxyisobutyrate dehydrogenase-like beta-hydroxyacid dehydrogenase